MTRALGVLAVGLVVICTTAAVAQEQAVRARNARPDIAETYDSLRTLSMRDLKSEFVRLVPEIQRGVWTLHLTQFLDNHPELTPEQRGVVFEALGLIASGAFEIDRRNPDYSTRVLEPVRELERRARTIMPKELVREALLHLSPESGLWRPKRDRITAEDTCTCRVGHDEDCAGAICFTPPYPELCDFYPFCGPLFMDVCDGVCH